MREHVMRADYYSTQGSVDTVCRPFCQVCQPLSLQWGRALYAPSWLSPAFALAHSFDSPGDGRRVSLSHTLLLTLGMTSDAMPEASTEPDQ